MASIDEKLSAIIEAAYVGITGGNTANLKLGKALHEAQKAGLDFAQVNAMLKDKHGIELPRRSRCSVCKKAYEAWAKVYPELGKQPVTLAEGSDRELDIATVSIDKLYYLVPQLEDSGYSKLTAESLLVRAAAESEAAVRARARAYRLNQDQDAAAAQAAAKTIVIEQGAYDALTKAKKRISDIEGQHGRGEISNSMMITFLSELALGYDPEIMETIWLSSLGEYKPEAEDAEDYEETDRSTNGNEEIDDTWLLTE